jgi:hypothetical protein
MPCKEQVHALLKRMTDNVMLRADGSLCRILLSAVQSVRGEYFHFSVVLPYMANPRDGVMRYASKLGNQDDHEKCEGPFDSGKSWPLSSL